ncbi:MAG: hypothetical protein MJY74_01890 [Bacteroidaceae bacterium]|nr:hypothetical protein [Bacteroidaceae bacterium]
MKPCSIFTFTLGVAIGAAAVAVYLSTEGGSTARDKIATGLDKLADSVEALKKKMEKPQEEQADAAV